MRSMKWIWIVTLTLFLTGCASDSENAHPSGLTIEEIQPNKMTAVTKQNLFHLAQVYDLSPFLYTKRVQVQSNVTPHSHPVILLNTKYSEQPKKLLSAFLHEEFQWWFAKHGFRATLAVKDLAKIYPKAPVAKNSTMNATYIRLMVCYLEYRALTHYLGAKEARAILHTMRTKDKLHPWSYAQVLNQNAKIKKVLEQRELIPETLR